MHNRSTYATCFPPPGAVAQVPMESTQLVTAPSPGAVAQVPMESTQPVTAPPPGAVAQVSMESTQPVTAPPPGAVAQVSMESTQPVTAPPPGAVAQVSIESTQPLTALPHESKPLPPGVTSSCLVVAQPNVTPDDKTYPTPISNWLAGLKLERYAELFQRAGYDTTDFLVGISEDVSENAGNACTLVVFIVSLVPNVRGKCLLTS